MNHSLSTTVMRKFISASLTTSLFSFVYAWLEPYPFDSSKYSISFGIHFHEAFCLVSVYMMYAAPAIYLYGTAASLLSEWLASVVSKRRWLQLSISVFLHCTFGLILLKISLLAAVIFFITDTLIALLIKQPLTLNLTLISHLIPLGLWIASVVYSNLTG
ncbi:hypothetical protein M3194_13545 [Paenibacillus glycanilyticus]|uniref:hypothetical protein n=1 Tax=Paenibacillus glycanilyticus TaxID=126569 RepID=UPI00203FDA76|nr:hypothetical protein [Paenibacillus glycanilyticus]MCM3628388.1 hypothetical protein [Paenibacillus glycanilyticus]